jgi:hypothetical protein
MIIFIPNLNMETTHHGLRPSINQLMILTTSTSGPLWYDFLGGDYSRGSARAFAIQFLCSMSPDDALLVSYLLSIPVNINSYCIPVPGIYFF